MAPTEIDSKLTPAASRALDELVNEYRARLLTDASSLASRYVNGEISVHDIVSTLQLEDDVRPLSVTVRERGLFIVLVATLVLDLVFAILSVGSLRGALATGLPSTTVLVSTVAASVVPVVAGFVMFYYVWHRPSYLYTSSQFTKAAEYQGVFRSAAFLRLWQQIELSLRASVAALTGESTATQPVTSLVRRLQTEGALSLGDVAELKRILAIRNRIVHAGLNQTPDDLEDASRAASRLLEKVNDAATHSA